MRKNKSIKLWSKFIFKYIRHMKRLA
jgi:hypothetical protein